MASNALAALEYVNEQSDAVLASEIEALPDRTGFLKFASGAAWNLVQFAYYEVPIKAAPSAPRQGERPM